jgi:hypothetical protein
VAVLGPLPTSVEAPGERLTQLCGNPPLLVAGFCEHGNALWRYVKFEEFLDQLSDCWCVSKFFAPWSLIVETSRKIIINDVSLLNEDERLVVCVFGLTLNSVNQLIFVMVKCGVLFEVRTEFLNNI